MSSVQGPCIIVSDWAGYLTATQSAAEIFELASLEAHGGAGTVRALITGVDDRASRELSINDLEDFL